MRKTTLTAAVLSGAAGLALTVSAAIPALADTEDGTDDDAAGDSATADDSSTFTDHLTRLKDALKGLVSDGTLTQDQADTVAETLDDSDLFDRHGGRGGPDGGLAGGLRGGIDLDVAAETLGLEADALRDLLHDGGTLADIAAEQGVEVTALVDHLLAAATERIDAAVADGSLDQTRADELKADLESRITDAVEQGMAMGGGHGGRGGPMGGGLGDGTDSPSLEG